MTLGNHHTTLSADLIRELRRVHFERGLIVCFASDDGERRMFAAKGNGDGRSDTARAKLFFEALLNMADLYAIERERNEMP